MIFQKVHFNFLDFILVIYLFDILRFSPNFEALQSVYVEVWGPNPRNIPHRHNISQARLDFQELILVWRICANENMLYTFHLNTNSILSVMYSLSKLISTTSCTTKPITTWDTYFQPAQAGSVQNCWIADMKGKVNICVLRFLSDCHLHGFVFLHGWVEKAVVWGHFHLWFKIYSLHWGGGWQKLWIEDYL